MKFVASPNYTPGRQGKAIKYVVIQLAKKLSTKYNCYMKKITLGNGKQALVDDDYIEQEPGVKWQFSHGYAKRQIQRTKDGKVTYRRQYLHRVVMDAKDNELVDHINQDKLDNRKSNLRVADKSVNAFNSKLRSDNTSGKRGITWNKDRNKWMAQVNYKGRHHYIGLFRTIEKAGEAYDKYLERLKRGNYMEA